MFQYTQQSTSINRFSGGDTGARRVHYIQQYTLQHIPPKITFEDIQNSTDILNITSVSQKYNIFIEKNEQILLLSDTIESYLDIRDALLLRMYKLKQIAYFRKCLY